MTYSDLSRLYRILTIILSYNLDTLLPHTNITRLLKMFRKCLFWIPKRCVNESNGMRLRFALEQLGPVWIKFGQMISIRRDIFPMQIIEQLEMLQSHVTPFDGKEAITLIERSCKIVITDKFDDFNITPLATASIAQVHTATLKENGREVIIKVIRPEIVSIIKSDIKLLYKLSVWILRYIPDTQHLRPQELIAYYEYTLMNELNLLREAANATQIRKNFKKSKILYVPKIYSNYCTEHVLVMERIYGIPISNIKILKHYGINMSLLAERGVQIFFTQVFRDSLFHADTHPGNIFVSYEHPEDPKYIGIDYGIVSTLNKTDKQYLAKNFLAFFNRDYRKVAELHIDSGWVPSNTNIIDFEFAIRCVCEPIFKKPLVKISFGRLLINLFNTARSFHMEVQPQLMLLQKTLLYVEGVGRQIDPNLNLWNTAKPFLEDWMKEQISIATIFDQLKNKIPIWVERLSELPDLVYETLKTQQNLSILNTHTIVNKKSNIQHPKKYIIYYLFSFNQILLLSGIMIFIWRPQWSIISLLLIIFTILREWFKKYYNITTKTSRHY
ncbi:ubiquinone biosynthesis regulatory protein kinase UbiB [Candidatus Erwinia haradaeae]|uniref:Probable protein kinase UbiB n=1 Tax=Candidatus Erwinia haradaeae TaxID=1922217 RepID=A0A451D3F0_9GAMM|nr:ubiquinone biosynthesis regulatory protein kinase UbiB [Candidatus Erwinia haradaeae]VFP80212.1 Probable protein kinase UbiB [Candidatus Erwinia haradaeae]